MIRHIIKNCIKINNELLHLKQYSYAASIIHFHLIDSYSVFRYLLATLVSINDFQYFSV